MYIAALHNEMGDFFDFTKPVPGKLMCFSLGNGSVILLLFPLKLHYYDINLSKYHVTVSCVLLVILSISNPGGVTEKCTSNFKINKVSIIIISN